MSKRRASSLVLLALLLSPLPISAQPELTAQNPWEGIDAIYPADETPGGAACGQQAGCYRKGTTMSPNSLNRCTNCCANACPGSNNCIRGCYANLVPRDRWPR